MTGCTEYLFNGTRCRRDVVSYVKVDFIDETRGVCKRHVQKGDIMIITITVNIHIGDFHSHKMYACDGITEAYEKIGELQTMADESRVSMRLTGAGTTSWIVTIED
jgi:hypothetical protein